MNPALWASAKALYFEASADPNGSEAYLDHQTNLDQEVLQLVRELLSQDTGLAPAIDRPCWAPLRTDAPRHALELGQTLVGRFEIVGFLGAGGVGEVYRAFDHQQSTFIALKTLRPALAADADALGSLRNELNTARLVTSPHVCRMYESHWPSEES